MNINNNNLNELNNSNFRRGSSKIYYDSDIWDPGEGRTSFRSNKSADSDDVTGGEKLKELNLDTHNFPDPIVAKPLPLLQHHPLHPRLNRSAELDDILEEDLTEDDELSCSHDVSSPSPRSASSPGGSFCLGPRDSSMRSSQNSEESSQSSQSSSNTNNHNLATHSRKGLNNSNESQNRDALIHSFSHKSQDSGFSDSADSNSAEASSTSPSDKAKRRASGDVRSEVVHETRTNSFDRKQYHVSKVYFYSVSDILSQEQGKLKDSSVPETSSDKNSKRAFCSRNETDHVSVLDCESYLDNRRQSPIVFLSPPMTPPPPPQELQVPTRTTRITPSTDDPCDTAYYNALHLEHKPLPYVSPASSSSSSSGTQTCQKSQISPRIHTGTSSLGRNKARKKQMEKQPLSLNSSPQTAFPKTNGSLYDTLGRTSNFVHDFQKEAATSFSHNNNNNSSSKYFHSVSTLHSVDTSFDDTSVSLPSPLNQNLDSFDDPLIGVQSEEFNLLRSGIVRDPVNFWLQELSLVHEAECTIMLQSKPVAGESLVTSAGSGSNNNSFNNSKRSPMTKPSRSIRGYQGSEQGANLEEAGFWAGNSSKDTIRAIQSRAHSISALFAKLCRQLGHRSSLSKLVPLVQGLSHQVNLFLIEYNKQNQQSQVDLPGYKPKHRRVPTQHQNQQQLLLEKSEQQKEFITEISEDVLHQQRILLQSCDKLKLTVSRHQTSATNNQNLGEVVDVITQLGATFTKLIELMLGKEIKTSVEALENSHKTHLVLKASIDSIINLALEGNHLCRLIAKHGGIRALLTICVDPKLRFVRVNSFRALGTVCCVLEGIMELEESGGIEIVSDTLRDSGSTEEEKSEAAGLLAQVTSPWIENNSSIEGLSRHLSHLVDSLTGLSKRTSSAETFLLSSAALANLTFMEPNVVLLMKKHSTVKVLVAAVKQQKDVSIYIQDQVAAVLANMAASVECRGDVVRFGGLTVLLRFLCSEAPSKPKKPEDFAQMAATERVQQKSAIAISRLCNDSSLAEQVVKLDGLERLVQLCKDEKSRVYSDGVLVSCLAAVRKISAICGTKPFQDLDASELVEPRLLDSFLIFSSKNESFV